MAFSQQYAAAEVPGLVRWNSDRLMRKMRSFLAITLTAAGVSWATAETLLRWFDIADVPVYERNPEYGYLMRPNQSVSTRGRRYAINSHGLRGRDFASPKQENTLRLLFVGDSVTYGGGIIREPDLFVNRIVEGMNTHPKRCHLTEAVNLSVPGWGIQNMAAYTLTKGIFEADIVVWVVPSADFRRWKTSLEDLGFPEARPFSRTTYVIRRVFGGFFQSRWQGGFTRGQVGVGSPRVFEENVAMLTKAMGEILSRGATALVVLLPAEAGYGALHDDRDRLQRAAAQMRISSIDMEAVFRAHLKEKLFYDGIHLSEAGHRVMAETLLVALQDLRRCD